MINNNIINNFLFFKFDFYIYIYILIFYIFVIVYLLYEIIRIICLSELHSVNIAMLFDSIKFDVKPVDVKMRISVSPSRRTME